MTAKILHINKEILDDVGLFSRSGHTYSWNPANAKPDGGHLPWTLDRWEIEDFGQEISQLSFSISLKKNQVLENLKKSFATHFPSCCKIVMQPDKIQGFWVLFEFSNRDSDSDTGRLIGNQQLVREHLPHGLAGLHLSVMQAVGQFSVFMTKQFFVGNTPGNLFVEFPKILRHCLFGEFLDGEAHHNLYVCMISINDIRNKLFEVLNIPSALRDLVPLESSEQLNSCVQLQDQVDAWILQWSHSGEHGGLAVPPIEILEQKEVSKRFQVLDELILLEDYPKALEECRNFLTKYPHSLYLIRRLSFLSLFAGVQVEKNFLDQMGKYDPQNIMTRSLWIRCLTDTEQSEGLLENLSRLGNSLSGDILDFETLNISSLTLPEMLGDAWSRKDLDRSVAYYERVLKARGEIPRILVKLIQLMREVADPIAEERYMDRLLACEVQVETRAAIYFRLAEIKESGNISEAATWALKGWQTNRLQAKYALLAAELLIKLARAREAIHVLVETAESLVDSHDIAARFDLELRIASIWLDELQRLDLAMERVERGRELAQGKLENIQRLIVVVERLEAAEYHADLALEALHLAVKSEDKELIHNLVSRLIGAVELVQNGEKQALIYGQILSYSLLDIEQIQEILGRANLNLPYLSILEAMEQLVTHISASEQGRYYLIMGDIAKQFGKEPKQACRYYEKALSLNCLSLQAFEALDQTYLREGRSQQRYQLLKHRLDVAQEAEYIEILHKLYSFDGGVSELEKDSYAVQIYEFDSFDTSAVQERISKYQQLSDGGSILRLVSQLMSVGHSADSLVPLMMGAVHGLKAVASESRFDSIAEVFLMMQAIHPDRHQHALQALEILWGDTHKVHVKPYLDFLVGIGEVPNYDLKDVLKILKDDKLKLDLLKTVLQQRGHLERQYLQEALRLSFQLKQNFESRIPFVLEWVKSERMTHQLWSDYLQNWLAVEGSAHSLQILTLEWPRVQSEEDQQRLWELYRQTLLVGMWDQEELVNFSQMLVKLPAEIGNRIKLAWVEHIGFEPIMHSRDWTVKILSVPKSWQNRAGIIRLLGELVGPWGSTSLAQSITNSVLEVIMEEQKGYEITLLLPELEDLGLMDGEMAMICLSYFIKLGERESISGYWFESLIRVSSSKRIASFLLDIWKKFGAAGRDELFFELAHEAIEQQKIYNLRSETLRELKIILGELLIKEKNDLKKAKILFEQAYASDRNDQRTWVPLIYLYREFAVENELYELLCRVLPLLKDEQELLRSFGMEFRGLDAELKALGRRLGLRSEQTEIKHFPVEGEINIARQHEAIVGPSGTQISALKHLEVKPESFAEDSLSTEDSQFAETRTLIVSPHQTSTRVSIRSVPENTVLESEVESQEATSTWYHGEGVDPIEALASQKASATISTESDSEEKLDFEDDKSSEKTKVSTRAPAVADSPRSHIHTMSLQQILDSDQSHDLALAATISDQTDEQAPVPSQAAAPSLYATASQTEDVKVKGTSEGMLMHSVLAYDWKGLIQRSDPPSGATQSLLEQTPSDKTELHMAIQVASLWCEEMNVLKDWPHQIWRNPQGLFYDLRWSERMGRDMFHPGVKSPLSRLLKILHPMIVTNFVNSLNIHAIAEKLEIRPEEILKSRRLLGWNDEVIQRTLLSFYTKYLVESSFQIYHFPKLQDRFYFDLEKREVYIDREYYIQAPPTFLFHRILFIVRAVSLDYFAYFQLNPNQDIYPFLMKCRRSLEQNKIDNFRRVMGIEKDKIKLMLSQADRDHLEQKFMEVGALAPDKIAKMINVYLDQIYRLNLAETLDLVGMVESFSNTDLFAENMSPRAIINKSLSTRNLLNFAVELKFHKESQMKS